MRLRRASETGRHTNVHILLLVFTGTSDAGVKHAGRELGADNSHGGVTVDSSMPVDGINTPFDHSAGYGSEQRSFYAISSELTVAGGDLHGS
jgi:hypothetical protein